MKIKKNASIITEEDSAIYNAQHKYGTLHWKISISQKKMAFNPKLTIELWYGDRSGLDKDKGILNNIKLLNFNPFYTFTGYRSANSGTCSHNTSGHNDCPYSSDFIGERISVPFDFSNPYNFNNDEYPQFKIPLDVCAGKIRFLYNYHINLFEKTKIIVFFHDQVNWSELYNWTRDNICYRVSDEFNKRLLKAIKDKDEAISDYSPHRSKNKKNQKDKKKICSQQQ